MNDRSPPRLTSAARLRASLKNDAFVGSIRYYDGQVDDAKYVANLVRTAANYGAHPVNQMSVVDFLREGERGARHGVDRDDGAREPERQLERRLRLGVPRHLPEVVPSPLRALHRERGQRDQDDDAEVSQRHATTQCWSAEGPSPGLRQPRDVNRQW